MIARPRASVGVDPGAGKARLDGGESTQSLASIDGTAVKSWVAGDRYIETDIRLSSEFELSIAILSRNTPASLRQNDRCGPLSLSKAQTRQY